MPDLNALLKAANAQSEPTPLKKKLSRGIRPDHIARGEVLPVNQENGNDADSLSEPNSTITNKMDNKQVADLDVKLSQSWAEAAKTDNKPETKWQQTNNKPITEVTTKWQQTDNKVKTEEHTKKETGNKPSTQPATEVATKWQQTDNKQATKGHFSALVGLQREIVILIYNQCKISRSKSTGPVALNFITSIVKTTENSAKVTIQRLEKKEIIKRVESKNGRGGWARFELSESIYRELLQLETDNKLETKWQQTDNKPSTQPATEPTTSSPVVVVSSNYSKNTTTTEVPEEPCFVIPTELSSKISRRQLSQFVLDGKISEYELQLSLDAFAYDLKNKLVSIRNTSNPAALLIGAIKNNGSYNSAKYVEVLKAEMRPLIETQREITEAKTELRNSKEWADFQEFKLEEPEEFKKLEEKVLKFGLKDTMVEEFTFMEYKNTTLKAGEEMSFDPLRPAEITP